MKVPAIFRRCRSFVATLRLFENLLAQYPDAKHDWMSILVELQGVRMTVSRIPRGEDPEFVYSPTTIFGRDREVEVTGASIADVVRAHGGRYVILRQFRVKEERLETPHARAVVKAIGAIARGGCEVLVDVNAFCALHIIGEKRRRKYEKNYFIPMSRIEGVHVRNIISQGDDDQEAREQRVAVDAPEVSGTSISAQDPVDKHSD